MIRSLVVDDEPLARRRVLALLSEQPDIFAVHEASHGAQAVDMIGDLRPDLVFLDVQMPEMTGFDVIAAVGVEAMPATVFVTAYDAYAVQAFEVQALDYLLKPFDDDRFERVVTRARQRLARLDGIKHILAAQPQRLFARSRGVTQVVHLDDVDWIGAAGDYAEVHATNKTLLIDESLSSLAMRLPADQFVRIHRGAIIRLDRVRGVRSGTHGDGRVQLSCGIELRVSRRFRSALDNYLSR